MICCAFLSAFLAFGLWVRSILSPATARVSPLAWRLYGNSQTLAAEKPPAPFSVMARLRSFRYAGRGLGHLIRREHNAWLHLAATVAVVALAAALRVNATDWRWIVVAIAMVLAGEALNTAIERLCDAVSPGPNHLIAVVKDVAAGAVLLLAIGAAVIGAITFTPYLAAVIADGGAVAISYCGGGPA